MIAVKSDTIYEVRARRDVLILHHDKLKICEARELPIRPVCVIKEPGEVSKQSSQEKNDKRGEESILSKTDKCAVYGD